MERKRITGISPLAIWLLTIIAGSLIGLLITSAGWLYLQNRQHKAVLGAANTTQAIMFVSTTTAEARIWQATQTPAAAATVTAQVQAEMETQLREQEPTPIVSTHTPTTAPTVVYIGAEQAIRDYFLLIEQREDAAAWEFLSDRFKAWFNFTSVAVYSRQIEEWRPATVVDVVEVYETDSTASITLVLYYEKLGSTHKLTYELVRDVNRGSPRFGYWLLESGRLHN